jgi:hypothetical protein
MHSKNLDVSAVVWCSSTWVITFHFAPNKKNLETALMVDTIVLLALIPQETMTALALHLVHPANTKKVTTA